MLSIGTKKYRNLQEQVAYNTECIKKLDEYLDGITIEDKLVIIDSDSGTFTDEELVILSAPLAFISDGSKVWMKQSETLVQLVFKAIDVVTTEVGSAYFNLGLSQIVINRETGAYNSSADTFFTTYSKDQIDSIVNNIMTVKANASDVYNKTTTDNLLALKANLAGADFTGNVTAPKLKQSTANKTFSFSYSNFAHGTVQNSYCVAEEINGVLYIIVLIKVTTDETGISSGTGNGATLQLDAEVGSKIYDADGIPLSQLGQHSYSNIACETAFVGSDNTDFLTGIGRLVIQRAGINQNQINVSLRGLPAMSANSTFAISGRIALTLI